MERNIIQFREGSLNLKLGRPVPSQFCLSFEDQRHQPRALKAGLGGGLGGGGTSAREGGDRLSFAGILEGFDMSRALAARWIKDERGKLLDE